LSCCVSRSNSAGPAGQRLRDIALQDLLHQIEGIQDLADLGDQAVTQGVKGGEIELHDPLVLALAEEHADRRRDLVAVGDDDRARE